MCLILGKDQEKKVAKTNIECFKVVEKYEDPNGAVEYFSFFQTTPIDVGVVMRSELGRPRAEQRGGKNIKTIYEGFHSFSTTESIERHFRFPINSFNVFRCIIPKGSEYYVGTFGEVENYCSNAIKYIEKI